MVKVIKLHEPVYDRVTALMLPKETYSDTVERILDLFDKLGELRKVLQDAAFVRAAEGRQGQGSILEASLRAGLGTNDETTKAPAGQATH